MAGARDRRTRQGQAADLVVGIGGGGREGRFVQAIGRGQGRQRETAHLGRGLETRRLPSGRGLGRNEGLQPTDQIGAGC